MKLTYPAVAWQTETLAVFGTPEMRSVSSVGSSASACEAALAVNVDTDGDGIPRLDRGLFALVGHDGHYDIAFLPCGNRSGVRTMTTNAVSAEVRGSCCWSIGRTTEVRVGQSTRAKVATALAAAGRDVKVVTIDAEGNVLPDWEIAGFTLVSAGDGTMKTIMVVAIAPRGGERPANVGAEEVAEMFEATSDINDWNGAAKLMPSVEVLEDDGAIMRFNVTPGDGTSRSAFLRIRR